MGGYAVESTRRLLVDTAPKVAGLGPTVENVSADLAADVGKLPEPEAGTSISSALTTVLRQWVQATPKIGMELRLLGKSVASSATMIEEVEVQIGGPFAKFAE